MCLLALSGCVFYAKDTKHVRVVSEEVGQVPIQTGQLAIIAQARDSRIRAFASLPRTCERERIENLEVTRGKTLGFSVPLENSGYGLVIGFMLAPITLPISGLITAIVLGSHKDTITADRRVSKNGFQPCPELGVRTLQVTFPSGALATAVSKADGTVELAVPADEPAHGNVALKTAGGPTVWIEYFWTHEVCEAQRVVRLEQANAASDRAKLLERVPRCHAFTSGTAGATDRVWDLAIGAAIAAARGDCRQVFEAETSVKAGDPQLHALVYGHPQITSCLQKEAARQQQMTDCMKVRADAMRAAQAIKNPQQRGDALRRIPHCN